MRFIVTLIFLLKIKRPSIDSEEDKNNNREISQNNFNSAFSNSYFENNMSINSPNISIMRLSQQTKKNLLREFYLPKVSDENVVGEFMINRQNDYCSSLDVSNLSILRRSVKNHK